MQVDAENAPRSGAVLGPIVITKVWVCSYGDYLPPLANREAMAANERDSESALGQNNPRGTLRTILLGSKGVGPGRNQLAGLALLLFGLTFFAYELDVFYHSGGLVWNAVTRDH